MDSPEPFKGHTMQLGSLKSLYCTCSGTRLPGVSAALIVRLPRSQAFYNLKTPALFAPYVVDLHGCFTFRCKVQVLLGQVGPQLPDFKLEIVGVYAEKKREKQKVENVKKQGE